MGKVRVKVHRDKKDWKKNCNVTASGCWEWKYARMNGYGCLQILGTRKVSYAHRYAYELFNGKIRKTRERRIIRHSCDNRPCVNPEHLILGTYSENIYDAYERHPKKHLRLKKLADKFAKMWKEDRAHMDVHQKKLGVRMRQLWNDPKWREKVLADRKSKTQARQR